MTDELCVPLIRREIEVEILEVEGIDGDRLRKVANRFHWAFFDIYVAA